MARSRRWVIDHIESLPHWARVAFAARCARRALPLLGRYWDGVPPHRVASLAAALDLVERSAAEGRPLDGLEEASADATKAAGAALMGIHRFRNVERAPTDEHAAWTASSAAKPVEWAAKAALAAPDGSAHAALEAFVWAQDTAHAAEEIGIIEGLHDDLEGLSRVAHRGGWTAQTPVPPTVFDLLSGLCEAPRPWWKVW
jgi:hypothetical protein